ncbi:uncharacterized protein V1510DRAFT_417585 [Dipodascopsis tothii]|uniref:uncharacterized protein n=1 Tax=Dipodascopsis tothii TaxID=44089 RepID=UPI0034CE6D5E
MRLLALVLGATLAAAPAAALFSDEAYSIDWHVPQIGALDAARTVLDAENTVTMTEANVLAGLDSRTGAVRWRLPPACADGDRFVERLGLDRVVVATTCAGRGRVAAVDAATGYVQWEAAVGPVAAVEATGEAVYVGTAAGDVVRLDPATGAAAWTAAAGARVHGLAALKPGGVAAVTAPGDDLEYVFFEPATGAERSRGAIAVGARAAGPVAHIRLPVVDHAFVPYTKANRLFVARLDAASAGVGHTNVSPPPTAGPFASYTLEASSVHPYLAITFASPAGRWTETWGVHGETGALERLAAVPVPAGAAVAVAAHALVHVVDGRVDVYAVPPQAGDAVKIASEPLALSAPLVGLRCAHLAPRTKRELLTPLPTCLLTLASHEAVAIEEGANVVWRSDQSLAAVVDVAVVDLPEPGADAVAETPAAPLAAFAARVARHAHDLRGLPAAVAAFARRFLSGAYDDIPAVANSTAGDTFGFRKFLVLATASGAVVALDTAHGGAEAWRLPAVAAPGQAVALLPSADAHVYSLVLASGETVAVDVFAGAVLGAGPAFGAGPVEAVVRFAAGNESYTAAWVGGATPALAFLPGTAPAAPAHFVRPHGAGVRGYVYDGALTAAWTFEPPSGAVVATAARHPDDPTVSIGRVLGNRAVHYKYLNPNLLAVASVDHATASAAVFLLDAVSGRVLHAAFHSDEAVDTSLGVQLVVGEHWVVYSYYAFGGGTPGEKVVVLDLYEDAAPNVRAKPAAFSAFDGSRPLPHVQAAAFLFPGHITALAVSRSRFGITSRDVVATLASGQVVTLPKRLLDARRPVGREPSAEEREEGVFKYDAQLVGDDRRFYVSHRRALALPPAPGVVTAPAALESTVLVFVHGLDLFFTRITPSQPFDVLSKSFNKGQLLLTIAGLVVGVRITGPMVRRKQLNARWGASL